LTTHLSCPGRVIGVVVRLILVFLCGKFEDRSGLTPADDLGYSLLDEEADLVCRAGNHGSSSLDEELEASC
jgi:hypothetical protein